MSGSEAGSEWTDDLRRRLDELLDEHRAKMRDSLDGLTEEEARRSLVPSRTTLLGLVKHVAYVEKVWFNQAPSVRAAYAEACSESRRLVADLALDEEVTGRGPRALWAIYVHMLREIAQHCGHADILREQILASRG